MTLNPRLRILKPYITQLGVRPGSGGSWTGAVIKGQKIFWVPQPCVRGSGFGGFRVVGIQNFGFMVLGFGRQWFGV